MADRPVAMLPRSSPAAADALLHPAAIAALGLLLLNDHYLKSAVGGPVTGKLSDFAGVAFFPLLLLGTWELAQAGLGRWMGPGARAHVVAVLATGLGFALVKSSPGAAASFGWLLGTAQWLLGSPLRLLGGEPLEPVNQAVVLVDPTDLVALVALGIPLAIAGNRANRSRRRTDATLLQVPAR